MRFEKPVPIQEIARLIGARIIGAAEGMATGINEIHKVEEGDLVLTPAGQRFAEAGVLEEKKVFRDQALIHIALLRQIVHTLEGAPGHTLPEEYFLSLLEANFDEDEA